MTKKSIELSGIHLVKQLKSSTISSTSQDTPFHSLIMGNFSGNSKKIHKKPVLIDRDNFDEVMQTIKPGLSITLDQIDQQVLSSCHQSCFQV